MKYKITYFENSERTIVKEKIEDLPMTLSELLGHAHVISAEEIVEKKPTKEKGKKVDVDNT